MGSSQKPRFEPTTDMHYFVADPFFGDRPQLTRAGFWIFHKYAYLGVLGVLEQLELVLGFPLALADLLKVEQPVSREERFEVQASEWHQNTFFATARRLCSTLSYISRAK